MVLIKKSCCQRCKQCDQWDTFFTGRTTCLSARVQSASPRWMNWMWHPRRKRKKKVWQKVKQREMRWKMRWQMSDERLDHIVLSRLPFLPPRSAPMKPGRFNDQSRLWSAFHWCLNVCRKWPVGNTFHPALILEISHRNCVMYACVCKTDVCSFFHFSTLVVYSGTKKVRAIQTHGDLKLSNWCFGAPFKIIWTVECWVSNAWLIVQAAVV